MTEESALLEDPPMDWEVQSLDRVKFLLSHAVWDTERKEVQVPVEECGGHSPTFKTLEEFRQYLIGEYTSIWYSAAPSENGGAVFHSMDEVDIVNNELSEYEQQISSLGWEL